MMINKLKMKLSVLFLLLFLPLPLNAQEQGNQQETKQVSAATAPIAVGFDVDDTILFSSPAFEKGFKSKKKPFSKEFWEVVNGSDKKNSVVKKKTEEIIKQHQKNGDEVYVITARESHNGKQLVNFLNERLGIKKGNIHFASKGKTELMRKLNIKIYYGDSDSDISDALEAGAKGVRIQRSEKSSYTKKYNPGSYKEEVIPDSAE